MNSTFKEHAHDTGDDKSHYRRGFDSKRETFDAREILQRFGEFDFGSVTLTEVCL